VGEETAILEPVESSWFATKPPERLMRSVLVAVLLNVGGQAN
jgi:hypothetical protein